MSEWLRRRSQVPLTQVARVRIPFLAFGAFAPGASLRPLQVRPPQFLGFCASKKHIIAIAQWKSGLFCETDTDVGPIPAGSY